jgi:hypothetical protein
MRALAVFAPLLVMSALSSQETQTVRLEPQADRSVAVVFVVDLTRASWPLERTDALREGMRAAMVEHLGSADLVGIAGVAAEIRTDGALVRGIQRLDARLDHALAVPLPDRFGTCRIWDGADRAVTMLASAPRREPRSVLTA